MVRKIMHILLLGCLLLPLAGCWDSVELNRRAVVSGMAIDKEPAEEKKYRVSFQTIVADEISGKESRGNAPVMIFSGTGKSIYEAFVNASRKAPRFLSLGHIRIVVLSEEIAREGIGDILDLLERESEMRLNSLMFVSRGQQARDILSVLTAFRKIPASELVQGLETTSRGFGYNFTMEVDDIIRGVTARGGGALINGVSVKGDKEEGKSKSNLELVDPKAILSTSGFAAFKGDKLKGWIEGAEAIGTARIHNKLDIFSSVVDMGGEDIASISVFSNYTTIKVNAKDPEHPVFTITIEQQARIKEYMGSRDLTNTWVLRDIEAHLSAQVKDETEMAVSAAKRLRSDYIRFGEAIERSNPKGWKKIKDHFEDIFITSEVHIKVNSIIRHTEMRNRPFKQDRAE